MMKQGGKPTGTLGSLMGRLMNLSHKKSYHWGLRDVLLEGNSKALDVGCGGGEVVRLLAAINPEGRVYGIDHSFEMVDLSKKVNQPWVENNQVEIDLGTVSSLPYPDNTFDIVTAFETIQFWPHLDLALQEILRVLKPSGRLLVANRFPDLQGKDAGWAEVLQIRSAGEYREKLGAAGFISTSTDERSKPGWILVLSRKP